MLMGRNAQPVNPEQSKEVEPPSGAAARESAAAEPGEAWRPAAVQGAEAGAKEGQASPAGASPAPPGELEHWAPAEEWKTNLRQLSPPPESSSARDRSVWVEEGSPGMPGALDSSVVVVEAASPIESLAAGLDASVMLVELDEPGTAAADDSVVLVGVAAAAAMGFAGLELRADDSVVVVEEMTTPRQPELVLDLVSSDSGDDGDDLPDFNGPGRSPSPCL